MKTILKLCAILIASLAISVMAQQDEAKPATGEIRPEDLEDAGCL